MAESDKNRNAISEAKVFKLLCSLRLNYLWVKKDYPTFLNEHKELEKGYVIHQTNIPAGFKLEILLGFARLHFWTGDFVKANILCDQIKAERRDRTLIYIAYGSLLKVMANVDMGNYKSLPYLINSSKHFLKRRNLLFEMELSFFNLIHKLKPFHSNEQKAKLYNLPISTFQVFRLMQPFWGLRLKLPPAMPQKHQAQSSARIY